MDLQMPETTGSRRRGASYTRAPHPRPGVTMFKDDHSIFAAMRAGARGYLLKGAGQDEILRAIQAVGSGEAIFSPAVATG